jgi:hypothetical protein
MPMTHLLRRPAFKRVSTMGMRTRKLIGTVAMLAFIGFYALFAMAVAEGRVRDAPTAVQTIVYVILGLIWVVPMLPLVRWMNKPDKI